MKTALKKIAMCMLVVFLTGCASPKYVGTWKTYFLNATMEIRENGTLTMDSGELFEATWRQEGNHIVIEGANIAGTAELSDDEQTLYFNNTFGNIGLKFEFYRVD